MLCEECLDVTANVFRVELVLLKHLFAASLRWKPVPQT